MMAEKDLLSDAEPALLDEDTLEDTHSEAGKHPDKKEDDDDPFGETSDEGIGGADGMAPPPPLSPAVSDVAGALAFDDLHVKLGIDTSICKPACCARGRGVFAGWSNSERHAREERPRRRFCYSR